MNTIWGHLNLDLTCFDLLYLTLNGVLTVVWKMGKICLHHIFVLANKSMKPKGIALRMGPTNCLFITQWKETSDIWLFNKLTNLSVKNWLYWVVNKDGNMTLRCCLVHGFWRTLKELEWPISLTKFHSPVWFKLFEDGKILSIPQTSWFGHSLRLRKDFKCIPWNLLQKTKKAFIFFQPFSLTSSILSSFQHSITTN